jgi:hypothetical protein
MAMHEESTVSVSESSMVSETDIIVVKEASGLQTQPPQNVELKLPVEDKVVQVKESDWMKSQEAKDFMPFLVVEMKRIKTPTACSGNKNEVERSLGQYKKLDSYISKALRSDWSSDISVNDVDKMRQQIERHIEELERMLAAHHEMKNRRKQVRRRASDNSSCEDCGAPMYEDSGVKMCVACQEKGLKKEATTPHFLGMQYQMSAFERAIVGTLINGVVSGGRDIEELFKKFEKKYDINAREKLAIIQILADMGYPVFKDRARIDENEDPTDEKEPREWQTQYYA